MKKTILAISLAIAGPVMAQNTASYARVCGLLAESAVTVAESARLGVPWTTVAEVRNGAFSQSKRSFMEDMAESVMLKAYYEWNTLDAGTIKQLAFMHCSAQESAVRRKYREQ